MDQQQQIDDRQRRSRTEGDQRSHKLGVPPWVAALFLAAIVVLTAVLIVGAG